MTILILSRGIPTPSDAQWGSFELDQAKALTRLGHKVIVAAVDTRFRFFWRKLGFSIHEVQGVKTYNLFLCPSAIVNLLGKSVCEKFVAWQWSKMIERILKNEGEIDLIYPHYLFNTYKAVHYLKDLHAPIVAIEHWSEMNKEPLPAEVKRMAETSYPQVQDIITVSKSLQARLKQLFNLDAHVVYNMVGEEFHYSPLPQAAKIRFIATGSLIYRKGFDLFAKAFSKLNLPKDKWELIIIGEGEERANLQKQIDAGGFSDNIHLVGSKNKIEIAKMLNESDVFVLPSRSETFGVVYIEAMACGLPVIATPCGGPEEFVNEKNGLLVPVDDVNALAAAIKHMYEHHQDYNRQAIADNCQARFSSEVIAKQLTKIFEKVIA